MSFENKRSFLASTRESNNDNKNTCNCHVLIKVKGTLRLEERL